MRAFKDSTFTKEREEEREREREEREREDETEEMRSRTGALRDDYVSGFRAKISQSANAGQSPSVASLAYCEASSDCAVR